MIALPDGTQIHVRPVVPQDAPLFHANFAHATEDDLRNRFFESLPALPDELVERLSNYDHTRELALVALPLPGADGPLDAYGIARLAMESAPSKEAELALIVRHDWQRRGVGRVLTQALLAEADRAGVRDIWALVWRNNRPMLTLLSGFGFQLMVDPSDPMVIMARRRRPAEDGPLATPQPLR
ncbi:hypothetical protein TMPK1_35250 [Rhodospirillales bacterium TMPK1]|uniref:N-acetyltransferase domain-containing protein n=1 Tax=Roseiterribacter gracilis TaxID=2812848 RepID=A0A8S8XBD2_9PROT|nr:hypothetical protein TMPK1_35250 [Rhodospirillales bacterium TMPK1]